MRIPRYPAYASQAWVWTLNPGEVTAVQARSLLTDAHAGAPAVTAHAYEWLAAFPVDFWAAACAERTVAVRGAGAE